ncbi:DUF5320 domain-containing protein [Caldisericum exile]|uniref:DUF5320 domain-containing protein n=1 Tax=Caldisericum exile (strain DSM 21853 / NBRC 104410 / AZM16c01) TaxID=511051 RepID=A0A7U6GDJ1_CALEA|nr:DUF5320 domain-containing protein [Caldisericum exile]BAL80409.1 hypothetical protein CSE_02830 [Caldisericum exile AZM16c01]
MPLGDRTGPLGLGPRTRRGLGYCVGYGFRYGFGRGFGWGGRFVPYYGYPFGYSPSDEKAILTEELKALENELNAIKSRLAELEKEG